MWKDIESAPRDGSVFLAFGSYLYPGDPDLTTYMEIAQYSGYEDFPWEDSEGMHPDSFFSHWMPLPDAPL